MKEEKKAVAAATKNETANATSAAKTTTPSTAASVKQAEPAKTEAPKAETKTEKPAETKPAATAAPKAETKTAAAPAKTEKPAEPAKAAEPAPAPKEDPAAKVAAFAAALNDKRETIEEMQKRLNEELQRLNHKKEVADKRSVFLSCSGKIDEYLKQLQQETEFDTNICRLTFEIYEKNQYGREEFHDLMTVSNTAIVTKFCNALKEEIAAKVAELENELLTA
jgi:hypothetical protein